MFPLYVAADLDVLNERINGVKDWMKENRIDLTIIADPKYRRYLIDENAEGTAVSLLVIDHAGSLIQITGQSRGASHADGLQIEVQTYVDYSIDNWAKPEESILEEVSKLCEIHQPRRLGFDYSSKTLSKEWITVLSNSELFDVRPLLNKLRLAKTPYEIERIRQAGLLNQVAYDAIRQNLSDRLTEFDLYAIMMEKAISATNYQVNFVDMSDLVSGERTMGAGGPPTNRRLQMGDSVIVDLFPTIHGYHADTCRSFIIGEPSSLQQRIHETVLSALKKAESLLYPGSRVSDIFNQVNEILKNIGYNYSLFHHLGHGIGVQDQEAPYLIPGSNEVLEEGMVVSVEPGIYVEGQGIRIENAYYIGKNGPLNLTPYATDI